MRTHSGRVLHGTSTLYNVVEQFTNLTKNLEELSSVELHVAYKIYIRKQDSLNDEFASQSKDVFSSEVENVDFSQQEQAVSTINSWDIQLVNPHEASVVA